MSATARSTSESASRRISRKRAKSSLKPAARLSSRAGIDRLPEPLDPALDLLGARLERCTVDGEPRADGRDLLDLDEAVRLQRRARRNEVDDTLAQAERGRDLDGAVELEAFG